MSNRRPAHVRAMFVLIGLMVMTLSACSAGGPAMPTAAPAQGDSPGAATLVPGAPAGGQDREPTANANLNLPIGALVIHSGELRLEVSEIGPAMDLAIRLIADVGGYVSGSQEQNADGRHVAKVTFRIPAARWNDAVRGLRELAERVVNENTSAVEVTAEVVDLEARIANLRAGEAALQEIMSRAGTIEEVLTVQRELSGVRGQIEQLTAQRDRLSNQAAYGTLAVHFETPTVAIVEEVHEGWQVAAELDRAMADLIRIGQAVTSLAIWLFIVVLPVVLPILVITLVALRVGRRFMPGNLPPAG